MSRIRDQLQTSLGAAYTLDRELTGGGMSHVFVAEETALRRRVIVKVLPPEMAAGVSTERFKREIAVAAKLQHPHIVPLLTAGEADGAPYFTMPFVEGESLRVRLSRHGELPVAEAIRVLREVASALQYAHEHGVVHRDIKPDNVLLSGGSAMVTDFGVAKAISASSNGDITAVGAAPTSRGVALGTPAYMAPEQASADPAVDQRADIYAFGVLAYELLTGQPPFAGRTPQALLAAHVTETPEPIEKRRANLPPALAALVMRCLEKRPADRPQTAADVVHALDDITTPSGGTQPTAAMPATRPSGAASRRRSVALVGTGALVLASVILGAWLLRHPTPASSAATPKSLAVLPLVNASADTANQYFADGMTDELTGAVARVPGLRVAPRSTASLVDTRTAIDVQQVARRLNVGALLEGRIRRNGTRLRLTMQLTNAADGLSVWSETYEREVTDAFKVQDEVARSIAAALSVALAGGVRPRVAGTANPEAHDLVLRGKYQLAQYNEGSLHHAVSLFERAVALDSSYADAWAGVADAWIRLADDFMPASEALPHARRAVTRAMALDSANANVLTQAATIKLWYDRRLDEAEPLFVRALALDSIADGASVYYSELLFLRHHNDSAAAVLRRLQRNDPTNRLLPKYGVGSLAAAGRVDEARDLCRRATELDSAAFAGSCRRTLLGVEERWEELLADCRAALQQRDDTQVLRANRAACVAEMLGLLGHKAEAKREAQRAEEEFRGQYVRPYPMAVAWAWAGDADRSIAWLEKAERDGSGALLGLGPSPRLAPLRGDPRFEAMVKRLGSR